MSEEEIFLEGVRANTEKYMNGVYKEFYDLYIKHKKIIEERGIKSIPDTLYLHIPKMPNAIGPTDFIRNLRAHNIALGGVGKDTLLYYFVYESRNPNIYASSSARIEYANTNKNGFVYSVSSYTYYAISLNQIKDYIVKIGGEVGEIKEEFDNLKIPIAIPTRVFEKDLIARQEKEKLEREEKEKLEREEKARRKKEKIARAYESIDDEDIIELNGILKENSRELAQRIMNSLISEYERKQNNQFYSFDYGYTDENKAINSDYYSVSNDTFLPYFSLIKKHNIMYPNAKAFSFMMTNITKEKTNIMYPSERFVASVSDALTYLKDYGVTYTQNNENNQFDFQISKENLEKYMKDKGITPNYYVKPNQFEEEDLENLEENTKKVFDIMMELFIEQHRRTYCDDLDVVLHSITLNSIDLDEKDRFGDELYYTQSDIDYITRLRQFNLENPDKEVMFFTFDDPYLNEKLPQREIIVDKKSLERMLKELGAFRLEPLDKISEKLIIPRADISEYMRNNNIPFRRR